MLTQTIKLPIYDIVVTLHKDDKSPSWEGGTIKSNLQYEVGILEENGILNHFNIAVDGLQSMILSLAISGYDITDPKFVQSIQSSVENLIDEYDSGSDFVDNMFNEDQI